MTEIKKQSVWRSPDLEVVTELKSVQGMPGGGTLAGESFTEETKEEISKLQTWTQEERTVCQSSSVREKRSTDCDRDWIRKPSRDWSRDRVETPVETE